MPIIAPHHLPGGPFPPKAPYDLQCAWPHDCMVQWGGQGIVLSDNGARGTAFFEAFPAGKGFFRGEGKTIEEAEAACFKKWKAFSVCDHQWGRGFIVETKGVKFKHGRMRPKLRGKTYYTNGGAICKKCKAFASVFNPVHSLGKCMDGPSIHSLTNAAEGGLRPSRSGRDEASWAKYARESELRLRRAGIDLPETPDTPSPLGLFDDPNLDPYAVACRRAVVTWYVAHREALAKNNGSLLQGFFESLEQRTMERLVEEESSYRAELEEPTVKDALDV